MRFISLALFLPMLLGGGGASASQSSELNPRRIEVFTTTDTQVTGIPSLHISQGHFQFEHQTYVLDAIERIEAQISRNLPIDLKQAKQIALQRIQQLDAQAMAAIQNASVGLAKAMQYGVDRYPAFVFDGRAVMYGVTDLESALGLYRQWLSGSER